MKSGKLYNIMFPIWFLLVFPISWLVVMPANFIIDTLVLFAGLKFLKVAKSYEIYKKSILKVWILGFAANIAAGMVLLLTKFISNDSIYNAIKTKTVWNQYTNIWSIVILFIAIAVSIVLLYFLNYKISFKKVGLDRNKAKKLAIIIAVVTAPWMLLFPSSIIYKVTQNTILNDEIINESKSMEIQDILNELDGNTYMQGGVFDSKALKISVKCNTNATNENVINEYKKIFESDSTEKTLRQNVKKIFSKIDYIDDVIFKVSDDKTYTFNRNNM